MTEEKIAAVAFAGAVTRYFPQHSAFACKIDAKDGTSFTFFMNDAELTNLIASLLRAAPSAAGRLAQAHVVDQMQEITPDDYGLGRDAQGDPILFVQSGPVRLGFRVSLSKLDEMLRLPRPKSPGAKS